MCGEKRSVSAMVGSTSGSPPRVRGKGNLTEYSHEKNRITPACAGKRETKEVLRFLPEDHPRVCGEKWSSATDVNADWGSPPRVRGKGRVRRNAGHVHGITPACAGKSLCMTDRPRLYQDHPRVCGEKSGNSCSNCGNTGSPPRVRGKGNEPHE